MPKVDRPDRPPKPPRRPRPNRRPLPGGTECTLPHVQPEPRIEDYVEVWPPRTIISGKRYEQIVNDQLIKPGLSKPNLPYWYGDMNLWAVDHDVAWFIVEHGRARQMLSSGTAIVPNPEELHPGTTILQTYEDGSVVVGGSGGDCDSISAQSHADFVWFANKAQIGFEFASGFLNVKGVPSGLFHSPAFIIDPNGELFFMEPKRPRETFLIPPSGITFMLYN